MFTRRSFSLAPEYVGELKGRVVGTQVFIPDTMTLNNPVAGFAHQEIVAVLIGPAVLDDVMDFVPRGVLVETDRAHCLLVDLPEVRVVGVFNGDSTCH